MSPSKHSSAVSFLILLLTLAFSAVPSLSAAGVSVLLDDRSYEDLERLEVKGAIKSGILSTRPLSRREAARLVREARDADLSGTEAEVRRLGRRFRYELGTPERESYLKPVDRVRAGYLYSDKPPAFKDINDDGDDLSTGDNLRVGLSATAELAGILSGLVNAELRFDDDRTDTELVNGYLAFQLGPVEVLAGKDSMWWGPGRHGALLMTNNAEALEMVKVSTTRPVILPSFLGRTGLFRPTVFLARLEKERHVPRANLLGMRLDFKPAPFLRLGLSRVFMFGGEGRESLDFSDWLNVFIASDEFEHSRSPLNGNQIASVDMSLILTPPRKGYWPFTGAKVYTEWGFEDSSGDTKTPTGKGNICGVYVDEPLWLGGTDLRVEWANTARNARYGPKWYVHNVYQSGYRYKGVFIGHHMGTDARDLFIRAEYYGKDWVQVGVEVDLERQRVHSTPLDSRWYAADIEVYGSSGLTVRGGAGMEQVEVSATETNENGVFWVELAYNF